LIAPTTRSGSSSGSDKTLCTPSGPLRGPNRGHRGSPPNDPTFGCAGIAPPAGTAPHPARTARPSTAMDELSARDYRLRPLVPPAWSARPRPPREWPAPQTRRCQSMSRLTAGVGQQPR
jgi:hypothetical protein